jgi:hypothetical protein
MTEISAVAVADSCITRAAISPFCFHTSKLTTIYNIGGFPSMQFRFAWLALIFHQTVSRDRETGNLFAEVSGFPAPRSQSRQGVNWSDIRLKENSHGELPLALRVSRFLVWIVPPLES